MLGTELTRWTIRLALLCLAARLGGELRWRGEAWWFGWSRGIWTAGCVCFVLHVVCAFQFTHHWSHADALRVTGDRTADMLGMRFGEGLYFSYLFLLLWLADVAWQWLAPASYRQRSPWLAAGFLAYMAFIAFNGAVVFEHGVTRWFGIPISLALFIVAFMSLSSCRTAVIASDSPR